MKSPIEDRTFPGHDSMVTVRLSEPPSLSVNTDLPPNALPSRRSIFGPECTPTSATAVATPMKEDVSPAGEEDCESPEANTEPQSTLADELGDSISSPDDQSESPRNSVSTVDSDTEDEEVNWEKLQQTEDEEVKDQDDNDNSTAMLLARLEQENNKLATNPKSVKVKVVAQPTARRPRPPSMAQLRDMVNGPTPTALRYSVLPPPPMTDLEFYMALVKDYQQTAARLPTLLSRKIRKGIPPPLRGVVWQSMTSARDTLLLEQFDRLSGETSPYEGLIGKDLGRSFPGVDMFRDPEGDGQRMLGRVLKCFSLYDQKIGYCQGLAFLVGPLLMHMPDNQAFCVLVRLMERYDLRSCFLPDLSGLHVRIYQFRELLRQNLTTLSNHLEDLQVDPAYVSQWFLSFFAVTCPLPMLFRIYDVIFAEGASETIMRVALSLMRKNESRILACTELEDVMQLLLSRGLWDCYHYNADEFVDDFVSLSNVVSREKLAQLEQAYREEKIASANVARALSPGLNAPSRPLSMLRRTNDRNLHSQIEDLLTALSELQRNHALLATQLQQEREERDEDRKVVKSLLDGLKKKANDTPSATPDAEAPETEDEEDKTVSETLTEEQLSQLMDAVEDRFDTSKEHHRSESSLHTKSQLREELARTKEHLMIEMSKSQEFTRRIDDLGQEANGIRDQLRESHAHVRNLHQVKQRLEKQVHSMRVRASSETTGPVPEAGGWFSSSASSNATSGSSAPSAGLRELKLGRSKSTPNGQAVFARRTSSLIRTQTEPMAPTTPDHDSLVLELVQAKTAEAVARQEADEYKQKLEHLRKAVGIAPGEAPNATSGGAIGVLGRLTNTITDASSGGAKNTASTASTASSATSSTTASGGGGFWGWRR
ncbi:putative gtpase activating protein [Eutypa lata UCREL1]|uniref:Putative gtpase activating protein n=1 Tax=Eutypa lata (strain UCR-EL1) TaxID=1287681 RepID=M7SKR2_EUTLA|nr:putative gtpase activating protein [Eutypa lata UCREL1]